VNFVYGQQWGPAAAALVGLAAFGALRTVMELFSDFLVPYGRTRSLLAVQLLWLPALAAAFFVLVPRYGIVGASLAHVVVATFVVMPAYLYVVSRVGVRPSQVLEALVPTLLWASLTAAIAWLVSSAIGQPLVACIVGGAVGLAIYLVPYRRELHKTVLDEWARRRS
jgi:PST family polysaccharide transporter